MSPAALVAIGTRPEAIRLAPVVAALTARGRVTPLVVTTGQHGAVVDDVLGLFGIVPRLQLEAPRRHPDEVAGLHADLLVAIDDALLVLHPEAVVVQGETATAVSGAEAGFLRRLPIVHMEGEWRSRVAVGRIVAAMATLHLTSSREALDGLMAEGHPPERIALTGSTVVDALRRAASTPSPLPNPDLEQAVAGEGRVVLIAANRRDAWGAGMGRIADAARRLATAFPETTFVAAISVNPAVRATFENTLAGVANVFLPGPLTYAQAGRLLARASLLLSDSDAVPEVAPGLTAPALVMADRPRGGGGRNHRGMVFVGADPDRIVKQASAILQDASPWTVPSLDRYNDGQAGRRSAEAIERMFSRAGSTSGGPSPG